MKDVGRKGRVYRDISSESNEVRFLGENHDTAKKKRVWWAMTGNTHVQKRTINERV